MTKVTVSRVQCGSVEIPVVELIDRRGKSWTLVRRDEFLEHCRELPPIELGRLFLVWDRKNLEPPTEITYKEGGQEKTRPATETDDQVYLESLWGEFAIDPDGGGRRFVTGRIDRAFHEGYSEEDGGYSRLALLEEPLALAPDDGTPKRIGAVVVCQRADGKIRVEKKGSLTDPRFRLRLPRASNSNVSQPPPGEHRGWLEANHERIRGGIRGGQIEVRYAALEFPDAEAMGLEDFRATCVDSLSRAALDVVFGR